MKIVNWLILIVCFIFVLSFYVKGQTTIHEQYTLTAIFSEPVIGINGDSVLGVIRVSPEIQYEFPLSPVGDATKAVGFNMFNSNNEWVNIYDIHLFTSEEKSSLTVKEVTAYQIWKEDIPAEFSYSFPYSSIGVYKFRDLAGNLGLMELKFTNLDKKKPSVIETTINKKGSI